MATYYLPSSGGYATDRQYILYRIVVEEGEFNFSTNTRPVTVSVQFWRTNDYTTWLNGTCYCTINDIPYSAAVSASNEAHKITLNSYTTLFSKTVEIPYSSGNASVTVKSYVNLTSNVTTGLSSSEQGGTVALTSVIRNYTITYDSHGGTGGPSTQTFTYNGGEKINSSIPARKGYTFVNWKASNGEYYFNPGDAIPSGWGDFTLIAQWQENRIKINHYSNYANYCAACIVDNSQNILVKTDSIRYSQTSNLYNYTTSGDTLYMTREDYVATGYWTTEPNGGEKIQQDELLTGQQLAEKCGVDLSDGNATINLYADWELHKDQRVYFDYNMGVVYARNFKVVVGMTTIEFDGHGDIYAASFVEDDTISMGKDGLRAKGFTQGEPI